MSIITSYRAGLAFFTRIPVGSAPLPPTLSGVVAWLPAVGLLVGALAALALLLAARLGLPAALCGISSLARLRSYSFLIFGMTSVSMNFLIKVDFPVRTGPTTPM